MALLNNPDDATYHFQSMLAKQTHAIASLKAKHGHIMIIAGGSNVMYNYDAPNMTHPTSLLGVSLSVGLGYTLNQLAKVIDSDTTVLLSIEPNLLTDTPYDNSIMVRSAHSYPAHFNMLTLAQQAQVLLSYNVFSRLNPPQMGLYEAHVYRTSSIGQNGVLKHDVIEQALALSGKTEIGLSYKIPKPLHQDNVRLLTDFLHAHPHTQFILHHSIAAALPSHHVEALFTQLSAQFEHVSQLDYDYAAIPTSMMVENEHHLHPQYRNQYTQTINEALSRKTSL
jgi:hypothetical protein